MIFDDHDVTDDWNLNPIWVDRVNNDVARPRDPAQRARLVCGVPGLGQRPAALPERAQRSRPGRRSAAPARKRSRRCSRRGADANADPAKPSAVGPCETLDTLFGLDLRPQPTVDGAYERGESADQMAFSVPGPKHCSLRIDNRTRRSFVSREGPPGNVAIPRRRTDSRRAARGPRAAGRGRAVAGDGPGAARRADRADRLSRLRRRQVQQVESEAEPTRPKKSTKQVDRKALGTRRMVGTNPDAIEAWAFDPLALEALLHASP